MINEACLIFAIPIIVATISAFRLLHYYAASLEKWKRDQADLDEFHHCLLTVAAEEDRRESAGLPTRSFIGLALEVRRLYNERRIVRVEELEDTQEMEIAR